MVRLAGLGAWLGAAVLAASYGGALHPIGDSFAVFRPQIAMGTFLLALVAVWRHRWAIPPAAGAVLSIALILAPALVPAEPGPITLYQKNMLFKNEDWGLLADDVRDAAPDVLLIQEMTGPNYRVIEMVRDILPNEIACPGRGGAGVAGAIIVTRYEVVEDSVRCDAGVVSGRAVTPAGPVTFAVLHLRWPWPYSQAAHVERILPGLRELERPVILAGDLNAAPWSHAAARIAEAIGVEAVEPSVPSYPLLPLVTVPIDHVFAGSGTLERRPLAGADHYGVLARVSP